MTDFRLPTGSVSNREVSNTAGAEITQDKLWHFAKYTERFGLAIGATPTTQEVILFQADKAGKLGDDISAALDDTGGATTTMSVDVKKNGTTVLSAPIAITNADSDRAQKAGTFASAAAQAYAIGDVLSCAWTATTVTGAPKGPMLNYSRVEQGD